MFKFIEFQVSIKLSSFVGIPVQFKSTSITLNISNIREFKTRYRFDRDNVQRITNLLTPYLKQHTTNRDHLFTNADCVPGARYSVRRAMFSSVWLWNLTLYCNLLEECLQVRKTSTSSCLTAHTLYLKFKVCRCSTGARDKT